MTATDGTGHQAHGFLRLFAVSRRRAVNQKGHNDVSRGV